MSDASPATQRQEEVFCNAVAAEFLVPREEFLALWQDADHWKDNLPTMESHFRVSTWVIARRALTLHKIGAAEYQAYIDHLREQYRLKEELEARFVLG